MTVFINLIMFAGFYISGQRTGKWAADARNLRLSPPMEANINPDGQSSGMRIGSLKISWKCDFCGREFEKRAECRSHEKRCDKRHDKKRKLF